MKHVVIMFSFFFVAAGVFGQSDRYQEAMNSRLTAFDTTNSNSGLNELANSFVRIGDAEKTQWHPFYYASLCQIMIGYNHAMGGGDLSKVDVIADQAEAHLAKAESILGKEESEIFCLKKMLSTLRMQVDPMTRWQTYGPQAAGHLAKAKSLNPENPRTYLLEGQDKFYTPEQFGGSKSQAKLLFEEALKKFESEKPVSNIAPHWGKGKAKEMLALCN
jgi:hypothetical protein